MECFQQQKYYIYTIYYKRYHPSCTYIYICIISLNIFNYLKKTTTTECRLRRINFVILKAEIDFKSTYQIFLWYIFFSTVPLNYVFFLIYIYLQKQRLRDLKLIEFNIIGTRRYYRVRYHVNNRFSGKCEHRAVFFANESNTAQMYRRKVKHLNIARMVEWCRLYYYTVVY